MKVSRFVGILTTVKEQMDIPNGVNLLLALIYTSSRLELTRI